MNSNAPIVIHSGSGYISVGFAGDDAPRHTFPAVVKRIGEHLFIGESALEHENPTYPIERGVITNWEDVTLLWEHAFELLRVDPTQHPVILTEAPLNSKADREKMAEIMMEDPATTNLSDKCFGVPALYVANQAVLALYAANRNTGIVLDSSSGVTYAVPIYEWAVVPDSTIRLDLGSKELVNYLTQLLTERGYDFAAPDTQAMVKKIMDDICYVALNFEQEMQIPNSNHEKPYQLLDGQVITIGNECFRCPEALFQPSFIGIGAAGIHEMIHNSIMNVDESIHQDLYANIILSGRTTLFSGMADRMLKEISVFAPPTMTVNIIAAEDRDHSVWSGGSKLAALETFQQMWVSKQEYEVSGSSTVHRELPLSDL